MKSIYFYGISFLFLFISCKDKKRWEVNVGEQNINLELTDISQSFFNTEITLGELKKNFPFFFDQNTTDEIWSQQRKDKKELKVYADIKEVFGDQKEVNEELTNVFAHYKYYYPEAQIPKVFVYSSGLQNIYEPVLYGSRDHLMFIALDGFLGNKSKLYDSVRVYEYMRQNMLKESLPAMVVNAIGVEIVPFNPRQQKFIDQMVYEGKKLILSDAFLPKTSDELKIGYTSEQIQWSIENEGNIWNYFIEQDVVFSTDKTLSERFIAPSPFSKFRNEIEQNSPGRIATWIGWQICKKYLEKNPKVSLQEFIGMDDLQKIFTDSAYKPSKGSGEYSNTKEGVDELGHYEE